MRARVRGTHAGLAVRVRVWAGLCVWVCLGCSESEPSPPPLEHYQIGGDFELTDENGDTFTLVGRRGQPLLLFFGFASCADVCPTTLSKLGEVMARLPAPALEVLFVTVDPKRDTAARLAAFTEAYPYRLTGLTGEADQIAVVARQYGAGMGAATSGAIDHSSRVYLIDSSGVVRFLFGGDATVEEMAIVIRRLL